MKELQEITQVRIVEIINELKEKKQLDRRYEKNIFFYGIGSMNAIRTQAEEIVFSKLIYI